jgi:hypothetical protein
VLPASPVCCESEFLVADFPENPQLPAVATTQQATTIVHIRPRANATV